MATFRDGSMGAAEQKANKIFYGVAAVVYLIILALFFVIPSYPKDWATRAPLSANVLGTVLVVASYLALLFRNKLGVAERKPIAYILCILLLLVFGVATIAGFNFDFVGIAPRP